jgi:outer membrane receptor protein involved in Fe transport
VPVTDIGARLTAGSRNQRTAMRALFFLALLLLALPASAQTGKLAGRVTDTAGEPVVGATVLLMGTTIGAAADLNGNYVVLGAPPGSYSVRFSSVGYQTRVVQEVRIVSNQTTTLDARLEEAVAEADEIIVTAERPIVDITLTSTMAVLSREDIAVMPVQMLDDIVNLQAGVIDGHFRGGRLGEVQYQVDGVSVNNPFDNRSTLNLDRSVLQEVQVISGTFDAEYGQAMSGVVNAVLIDGSQQYLEWSAEGFAGDFLSTGHAHPIPHVDRLRPTTLQNVQGTLSGPTPLRGLTFLLSGRRFQDDGWLFGERRFSPQDRADFEQRIFTPTGDGAMVAMAPFTENSGLGKLTLRLPRGMSLGYQAIVNQNRRQGYDHQFRLNPDGRRTQRQMSIVHGLDWSHTLSSRAYYTFSLRQNYFDYSDYAFEDVYDPRYREMGRPMGDFNYEIGAFVQGVDLNRFIQNTDAYVAKGILTWQATPAHLFRVGLEAHTATMSFGPPGVLVDTSIDGEQTLVPRVDHPDYPRVQTYRPLTLSAFAQDRMEWRDLRIRAGLRLELYDANATVPSDLENPANAIEGAPESFPRPTTVKVALAPRLGVSYPILDRASVFFSYGHFYQMPGFRELYSNSDYTVLDELQAGGISYGVLGNPDLNPEFTTQYEFGFKMAVGPFFGLDLSLFYKDIRNLLGVEFVSTYAAAEYARLTNIDFGGVSGFTLKLNQRGPGIVSASLDYTLQMANGNASDPRETANRAAAGQDPRPRQIAFNWDQRHTLNGSLILFRPEDFAVTAILRFGSGQPYTPTVGSGFGAELEPNSGRKPPFVLMDLRAEKFFALGGMQATIFGRAFNLFDQRFANGFVFGDTGSPFYSLNPTGDAARLIDPSRFYPPRKLEFGLTLRGRQRVR